MLIFVAVLRHVVVLRRYFGCCSLDMTDTRIVGDTILVLLEALMMKLSLPEILMVTSSTGAAFTVSIQVTA